MKRLLKSLAFNKDRQPTQAEQAEIAQKLADLLQQAKALGQAHVNDMAESMAWGGKFADALGSAWGIVTNFVNRIVDWINGQDAASLTEADIEAEVEAVAEHVGDFEVAAAIESEVLRELTFAGVSRVRAIAQPGACELCQDRASAGAMPIDDFTPPPYHNRCRCSTAIADEEE